MTVIKSSEEAADSDNDDDVAGAPGIHWSWRGVSALLGGLA